MEVTNGLIRIGVYICHCGTNISNIVDSEAVTRFTLGLPGVTIPSGSIKQKLFEDEQIFSEIEGILD